MRTVWKYPVAVHDRVRLPARVLHAEAVSEDSFWVWCELDPEVAEPLETYVVVGTGHPVPRGADYRLTVICRPFVWHLYRVPS